MCSGLSHEKVSFPPECMEVTVLSAGGRGSLPGPTSVIVRTFHQTLAASCGSGQLQAAPSPLPTHLSTPTCLLCLPFKCKDDNFPVILSYFSEERTSLECCGCSVSLWKEMYMPTTSPSFSGPGRRALGCMSARVEGLKPASYNVGLT